MKAYSTVYWKQCAWPACNRWFPRGHSRNRTATCSPQHANALSQSKVSDELRAARGKRAGQSVAKKSVKKCRICDQSFHRSGRSSPFCLDCIPDQAAYARWNRYRINEPRWQALVATYNGKCWICRNNSAQAVDHCHLTGQVRGALCLGCNVRLGQIEREDWLLAAEAYLQYWARFDSAPEPSRTQLAFDFNAERVAIWVYESKSVASRRRAASSMRQWAIEQGYEVHSRGRLKAHVVAAWRQAHPGEDYEPLAREKKFAS